MDCNEGEGTVDFGRAAVGRYRWWQQQARDLIEPLAKLMKDGDASLDIDGPSSDHGSNADRLESFARPFLLWTHWSCSLQTYTECKDEELDEKCFRWFRRALAAGVDPDGPQFWGYSANFHQHTVEIGLLCLSLELGRARFWDRLSAAERERALDWIESDAGNGHHWNNHIFFGIFSLEFLKREGRGREAYGAVIERQFRELERMYAGDGWYMDGMNQAFDFYNAYAWHYYSLWWMILYGKSDAERCERWKRRCGRFLSGYALFFARSGEHPAFGRSITYRFNASAPVGLAQLLGCSPLSAGQSRELCRRNLSFFLSKPLRQSQGCLGMGWHDVFEGFAETYSCGASVYWAAKAFAPLLIDLEHPFWTEEDRPLPAEEGDRSVALQGPALVVRSVEGEVELINVGTQIASGNKRFGPHKWGRLSYRTNMGFTVSETENRYPLDGGLTAQIDGGESIYGRHYTVPVLVERERMACFYSLGGKEDQSQIAVETRMWWRGNWQLVVHLARAKTSALLRQGGYALSADSPQALELERSCGRYAAWGGVVGVALQSLAGYDGGGFDSRLLEEDGPRRHIQAPFHATPFLSARVSRGQSLCLVSLGWAGSDRAQAVEWSLRVGSARQWTLSHEHLGDWVVSDSYLPAL